MGLEKLFSPGNDTWNTKHTTTNTHLRLTVKRKEQIRSYDVTETATKLK